MVSSRQLGQIIKQARKETGMTQDDLSDKAGLAYSTLAKIEQGAIKAPSFFTVYALSEALGLQIGELLGAGELSSSKAISGAKSAPENKIKFVYSDLNGVLVRFHHRVFVAISEETGCNLGLIETAFWHYNDTVNEGSITMEQFNQSVAQHLGVKSVDWGKHYMKTVRPIKAMHQCLEDVHSRVKVGLLTNTMPGFVDELSRKGLLPNIKFDAVVDSSVEGAIKPSQAIYEIAEERSGYRGEEILFIDDSRVNLIAAEKLGWRVMWFDSYNPEDSVQRLREIVDNL